MVYGKASKKIQLIEENHVVTTAGSVSDIQLTVKIIKAQVKLDEMRRGKKLMTKEIANLIAGLNYSALRTTYAIASFLLAGRDERGFHVYDITPDGSIIDVQDYAGDGSGVMFTTGVFEANYRKDMGVVEGANIVVYTKDRNFFLDNEGIIKSIVDKIKKRVELRADPSIALDVENAEEKIKQIIPKEAKVAEIEFDPQRNRVIIEAEKPGLAIGKDGEVLKEIRRETLWVPTIKRTPALRSKIIE